jgi:CheY-like chemotaxis protein
MPARKLHILVAEDNEINQKMAKAMLNRQGHEVDLATNGHEAVEAYRCACYDLILMDVQMPDMDGFEASRRIREMENGERHTPIVALTAYAMQGDRQRCLDAGMDDYLTKPLDPRKVFQMIERWVCAQQDSDSEESQETGVDRPYAVLDMQSALPRFSYDSEFFKSLLDDFLHSLPEKIGELKTFAEQKDYTNLAHNAHSLKGAAANFSALKTSKTVIIRTSDYDVFGDGSVVIKSAPGHSPDHQVLYVKLAKTGPVLLSGDLYHHPEERNLRRVPTTEFNGQQTAASRAAIESFLQASRDEARTMGFCVYQIHTLTVSTRIPCNTPQIRGSRYRCY